MKSATLSSKTYSVLMFLAVSVLAGLLLSGLAVPWVALASTGVNATADAMKHLPADLATPPQPQRSKIVMGNGETLATFYDENRVYVGIGKISKHMQNAQIAIEDHRFYKHGAIDPEGLGRAMVKTLTGDTQGASTLTQQYVKLVRVEAAAMANDQEAVKEATRVSLERKIVEMRYALAIEEQFSKTEILERYLNIAYYGDGAYGVEAAAQHYFGTTAKNLNIEQSAMLAGLVQNPVQLNPRTNPQAAIERRNHVLNRMAEVNHITKAEAEAAKKTKFDPSKIRRTPNGCVGTRYPFLCDYVKRTLVSDKMPSMGATEEERTNRLNRGGLTIKTLINPDAQDAAQKAVARQVSPTDPVLSSAVLLQPKTGLIVAMAQSRPVMGANSKAGETFWNINVEKSMGGAEGYQAGSTFKTYAIAAGLEQGMTPNQSYVSPATLSLNGMRFRSCDGTFRFSGSHSVGNGGANYGAIPMTVGTAKSVNTYFMQLVRDVGICQTTQMAQRTGVKLANGQDIVKTNHYFPSFVLGTSEITPLSLAESYATFANRGVHCAPIILESVQNSDGVNLEVPSANCKRVISEEVADGVSYLLKGVVNNGTGRAARLSDGRAAAGKTGTTQENQAVWFAGYTPEMAGVAMITIDKTNAWYKTHRKTLRNVRLPSGTYLQGTGGGDAGLIWKSAMTAASKNLPKTSFENPSDRILEGVKVPLPNISGMGYDQAKAALEEAGFQTTRWGVYSDSPKGTFMGTSPSGSAVKFSTIRLKVSMGPRPPEPTPSAPAPPAPNPGEGTPAPAPSETGR